MCKNTYIFAYNESMVDIDEKFDNKKYRSDKRGFDGVEEGECDHGTSKLR